MKNWPDQLKLFAVLATVKVLLEKESENDGWPFESPQESLKIINQVIVFFLEPEKKFSQRIFPCNLHLLDHFKKSLFLMYGAKCF